MHVFLLMYISAVSESAYAPYHRLKSRSILKAKSIHFFGMYFHLKIESYLDAN